MKLSTIAATALFAVASSNAFALHTSVYTSTMDVTNSRYGFSSVNQVQLTLAYDPTVNFGIGKMSLVFTQPSMQAGDEIESGRMSDTRRVALTVTQKETDGCGSVHYYANLSKNNEDRHNGARFHVELTDHSHRKCEDLKPYRWEAEVREGYGFCGTMDSTMSLVGNPIPLYFPVLEEGGDQIQPYDRD